MHDVATSASILPYRTPFIGNVDTLIPDFGVSFGIYKWTTEFGFLFN